MIPGLIVASDELKAHVDGLMTVCAAMDPKTFTDWEKLLIPENDPRIYLRRELQRINDCQANAGTNGLESLLKRSRGVLQELSRMWLYMMSEIRDGRLGANAGSSIQSGIATLIEFGCPLELLFAYSQYTRSRAQFDAWNNATVQADAATRKIAGSIPAPSFNEAKVHTAIGNPIHWGTFWGLNFRTETITPGVTAKVCRRYRGSHGDGGHATEVLWPVKTTSGEWLLYVENSHGDGSSFYVSEDAYEEMRDRTYTPYGAYVLLGHEDPVRQYEGQFSAMG